MRLFWKCFPTSFEGRIDHMILFLSKTTHRPRKKCIRLWAVKKTVKYKFIFHYILCHFIALGFFHFLLLPWHLFLCPQEIPNFNPPKACFLERLFMGNLELRIFFWVSNFKITNITLNDGSSNSDMPKMISRFFLVFLRTLKTNCKYSKYKEDIY